MEFQFNNVSNRLSHEVRPIRYQEIQPTKRFASGAGYVVHVD